jgi:hypothetical protein
MMTLRRARHRVTALHRLLRRSHRVAVESIRCESDRENSYQDWSGEAHLDQIRREPSTSQVNGSAIVADRLCGVLESESEGICERRR